jgi:hypothetical protein
VAPLGTTSRNVKEPKLANIHGALSFKSFHNYKILFSHVYPFNSKEYALKFLWDKN